jgi:CheY-like chemotaxis protein
MVDTSDQILSILYVDDEPGLLEIGKIFLEKTGMFTVTTAGGADEGIKLLKEQPYDAIISDYQNAMESRF